MFIHSLLPTNTLTGRVFKYALGEVVCVTCKHAATDPVPSNATDDTDFKYSVTANACSRKYSWPPHI